MGWMRRAPPDYTPVRTLMEQVMAEQLEAEQLRIRLSNDRIRMDACIKALEESRTRLLQYGHDPESDLMQLIAGAIEGARP